MRTITMRIGVAVVVWFGAAADVSAQYSRETPLVKAVQKTKPGVVNLKVTKQGQWGQRSIEGTGVLVDERGYLITNAHVVASAISIKATLSDKTTLKATVVKELPSFDLAILRVTTKKKLKALTFGPASDLMEGETVIAIGNPYGYGGTVTTGIISALDREITMPSGTELKGLIQTSCAINPGNSGGPLVNINGEVIGINVALRDGAQCIAFAINSDTVKRALRTHLSAVKVSKVAHGLQTKEEVRSKGPQRQKVVVQSAKGLLKKGDVILKMASLEVNNSFDLERAVWGYKAGDKIQATILRDGKKTQVPLTLAGAPTRATASR